MAADLQEQEVEAVLQLRKQQANLECELEKQGKCMPALRDRHGETLDSVYTYIEWLSDALYETYCHEIHGPRLRVYRDHTRRDGTQSASFG
ncbi:hypothetical protein N7508_009593 [Penicillium antarcticum]|uniref:uncharacterized protein n=1 Tax=Penicillium antarcticum TaxID=416450 RepID=UPI0023A452AA|nr:uncharacterized protein N7508_009593 [Penicillium antarcticum]KAJ5294772.1 hypothetical protein N7508_009593 [Penicillium antarcticum]